MHFVDTQSLLHATWITPACYYDRDNHRCLMWMCSTLDVSNNAMSGTIPAQLGLVPELGILSLANNAFTGSIPHSLSLTAYLGYEHA